MVSHDEIRNILSPTRLEDFELESSSRAYNGFTLFMKHYYHRLKADETPESLIEGFESMRVFDDSSATVYSDDASSISTTLSVAMINSDNIIMNQGYHHTVLANIWNNLDASNQSFWNERAKLLNQQPLVGHFVEVPRALLDNNQLSTCKVLKGLSLDWHRFVKGARSGLLKDPSSKQSSKTYKFISENITVGLQSYRKLSVSTTLVNTIFGENFEDVHDHIVYRSKNRIFMYFASYKVLKDIFKINNLSAVEYVKKKNTYLCCGKVNIQYNKQNILGYVLDENQNYFKVLMADNMGIKVRKPLLVSNVREDGKTISVNYDYGDINEIPPDTYAITYFWPTRIKVYQNAVENVHILMNKVVLNEQNEVQVQLSS